MSGGGGFGATKEGERSEGATEVAYTALTAYLRMLEGETALYDMSDVEIEASAEEKPSLWDRIVGWFR